MIFLIKKSVNVTKTKGTRINHNNIMIDGLLEIKNVNKFKPVFSM